MTALADGRETLSKISAYSMEHGYAMAASTTIYDGSLVGLNAAGTLAPAGPGVRAIGRAHIANARSITSGASVVLTAQVRQGIYRWVNGDALTVADRGLPCYAIDDQTVQSDTTGGATVAGVIYDVDADGVWVLTTIEPAA